MRAVIVLAVLLAGCGGPTYCTTRCGLELKTPGDCAALQAQEDVALQLYDDRGLFALPAACGALSGYSVSVADNSNGYTFIEPHTTLVVSGYTDCDAKEIVVSNERWHYQSNALSHEMIHAVLSCYSGPDGKDFHWHWSELGYYDAIEAARPDED